MKRWRATNVYIVMIAALVVIAAYSLYTFGLGNLPQMFAIILISAVLDAAIIRIKDKRLVLPKSAIITGLILSLIVQGDLFLVVFVPVIAILSKHVIKIHGRHLFNPANFGLLVGLFLPVSESWWGTSNIILVGVLGIIIIHKLRKMRQAFAFLVLHAVLIAIYFSMNGGVEQTVGHMISGLVLFFAFYMLIEPVTSPVNAKGRTIFGLLVGVLGALSYVFWLPAMLVGSLFFADILVPILNRLSKPKIIKSI
ncbi:MAG: RnfABCDGE type electron transport complex subunit D [Candidatus Aenigmatarchaeota archaeon]